MTIRDRLESNIVFWTFVMLFTGFLSGIATYKGILELAQLEVVSKSELIALQEGKSAARGNVNYNLSQLSSDILSEISNNSDIIKYKKLKVVIRDKDFDKAIKTGGSGLDN